MSSLGFYRPNRDSRHRIHRANSLLAVEVKRQKGVMRREDYYRQKASELLVVARATRDPGAADWLRGIALGYERLAKRAAHGQPDQYWSLTEVA
jgi:hypothetical protein